MLSYSFSKRMSEKTVVTVTKVGEKSSPPPTIEKEEEPKPKSAGTVRKPLKSILKVKGVADPAKAPPLKKTAKRSRIQILTEKGSNHHRKTVRRKLRKMTDTQVKEVAQKHGLIKGKNTPPELTRKILEGGITAGFVSL
jgi:hypothetical protein